jgi:hypothetical protein
MFLDGHFEVSKEFSETLEFLITNTFFPVHDPQVRSRPDQEHGLLCTPIPLRLMFHPLELDYRCQLPK